MTRNLFFTGSLAAIITIFSASFILNLPEPKGTAVIAAKGQGGTPAVLLPSSVTAKQVEILKVAYNVAKQDGLKNPEELQALVFQETKAGGMKSYKVAGQEFGLRTNERYYGVAQMKLSAAKDVLLKHPEIKTKYLQTNTDEEIVANLILNNEFAIRLASKYYLMMAEQCGEHLKIAAYNQGCGGAKKVNPSEMTYVKNVKMYSLQLKMKPNQPPKKEKYVVTE